MLSSLDIPLASGAVPPGFNPPRRGEVYRLVPFLGECRRGPRHFWDCRARVGSGPEPGPILKKALCNTRPVGGTEENTARNMFILFYEQALSGNGHSHVGFIFNS